MRDKFQKTGRLVITTTKRKFYEQPASDFYSEAYTLNQELVGWAFHLTQDLSLTNSDSLRKSPRFAGFPNVLKPPFVARGDVLSASMFWHGS
jgi:purine nucleoside permease